MKDNQLFLFKMTFILLCLLLILYYSINYMENKENNKENFTDSIEDIADILYKKRNQEKLINPSLLKKEPASLNNSNSINNGTQESVTVHLDKAVLGEIVGIDFDKVKEHIASNYKQVPLDAYQMPSTDYCDLRNWIPKEAVRSLCPGCEPDKL